MDAAAIGESHFFSIHKIAAFGSEGDSELIRFFGEKGAARFFFKEITQTIRAAMCNGEGGDREILRFEEQAGFNFLQFQRHGRLVAAQDNII